MTRRIIAIAFIWACSALAWGVLGATIFSRTNASSHQLDSRVASNWGTSQEQRAPSAFYEREASVKVNPEREPKQKAGVTVTPSAPLVEQVQVPLIKSRVKVGLDLEHRQKGLLWYATYKVAYHGTYTFRNTSPQDSLTLQFDFPAAQAVYDDVVVTVNDIPMTSASTSNGISTVAQVAPGATVTLGVQYRSQGLDTWRYSFGQDVTQVQDFALNTTTNFKAIDFSENSLSPSAKRETKDGWNLEWNYKNLVSGYPIGIVMPAHLQPGLLAGEISFFAPVSLFFFFFLMFIITTVRRIELHPMNYFFLAAAFFAFHLLLAYLVDHLSIHLSFLIASIVSVALVISYLRLVVDLRFAVRDAATAQLLFLVLFSYAFFFKGFTGLAITIGSIITLFVVMQMTGRVRWADKFARVPEPAGRGRTRSEPGPA